MKINFLKNVEIVENLRAAKFKAIAPLFLSCLLLTLSVNSRAGIFDDIGDIVDDIVDAVTDLFSSAKNVAESLADKIDKEVITNISGRCSLVEAEHQDGDTETQILVEECGFGVGKLKSVFVEAGGDIAEQAKEVESSLVEVSQDLWNDEMQAFANTVKDTVLFLGDTIFSALKDSSNDLLSAMNDLKTTLADFDFPYGNVAVGTTLDVIYNIPLGTKGGLEFFVRGQVVSGATVANTNYIALKGQVTARLKSATPAVGYTPQVFAQVDYTNPILKIEDNRITGILVNRPNGSISLTGVALPLQFSATLEHLMSQPGFKNIPFPNALKKAVSFDADIGTLAISLPLTNQEGTHFTTNLSVSGGVDAIAQIVGNWRIRVAERVSWDRDLTFDIPSIKLPISSLPPGIIGELEQDIETEESSGAQLLLSYPFNDQSGSEIISDISGKGNHGQSVGGLEIREGVAYFNGQDAYVKLPDDILRDVQAVTVHTEVFIEHSQGYPYFIYGIGNTSGDWGDGYLFTTGNFYRSAISSCNWGCEQNVEETGLNLPRGSWQKITYTLKDNVSTLYLNGDVVNKNENMNLKPADIGGGNTRTNYIGRSLYSADKYLYGAIRDFQVWDGALTHKEIVEKFGE